MTKQIIINGVDVSECNFRLERDNQQKCECSHATGFGVICDCEKWHNCDFKQLKRKEQKLKKIKDYCSKNKVAGWVDIEGIIEIIEGKENDK